MGTPKKLRFRMPGNRSNRVVYWTNSTEAAWTLDIVNGTADTWYVYGDIDPLPAPQTTNNPVFDLSNNTGIVRIVGTGAEGLTRLDRDWKGDVTAVDISECTNLDRFELTSAAPITEIDITKNANLQQLTIPRNSISDFIVNTTNNPLLTHIECDYNNLGPTFAARLSAHTILDSLLCNANSLGNWNYGTLTNLINLNTSSNGMTGHKSFPNNTLLQILRIDGNPGLGSIDVSDLTALTLLYVQWCGLSTLDVSSNTNLTHLRCHLNNLSTLDVSACTGLNYLSCHDNGMDSTATDSIWNQVSTIATNGNINNGTLIIRNNRTTAADAAFSNLSGRGWTLTETID